MMRGRWTPNLLPPCALLAVLAIVCKLLWPSVWGLYAAAKLGCTACIIVYAYLRAWGPATAQDAPTLAPANARRHAVMLGLVLSWWGDLALLWPKEGFLLGLLAFLLAHLAFIYAFSRGVRLGAWPLAFGVYGVLGAGMVAFLWPTIPVHLRLPVGAYVCCLVAMAGQTASEWRCAPAGDERALAAAAGGLLFLLSDTFLAFDKFYAPLPLRALWVGSSYWGALGLIAYSLQPRAPSHRAESPG